MEFKKKKRKKGKPAQIVAFLAGLLLCLPMYGGLAKAAPAETYTVSIVGHYRHPNSGVIEDSGGESSYALGQSMVESVVDPVGLLELEDDTWALYIRFHLMDNISQVSLSAQENGADGWDAVEAVKTGSGEESGDFYIPLPSQNAVVRAECYVDAMGRSVVFYITYESPEEGDTTDLAKLGQSGQGDGSSSQSGASPSGGAQGLVVGRADGDSGGQQASLQGESQAAGAASGSDAAQGSGGEGDPGSASSLTLDDSVWMVLFGILFCADLLAGFVLMGIGFLAFVIVKRKKEAKDASLSAGQDLFGREEEAEDDLKLDFMETEG